MTNDIVNAALVLIYQGGIIFWLLSPFLAGLLAMRRRRLVVGWALLALSAPFLVFCVLRWVPQLAVSAQPFTVVLCALASPIIVWVLYIKKPIEEPGRWKAWTEVGLGAFLFLMIVLGGINQMQGLTESSQEKATVGNLGTLRSAIEIYYEDNKSYPSSLDVLIPRYLSSIPTAYTTHRQNRLGLFLSDHPTTNRISYVRDLHASDEGGWGYVNNSASRDFGKVFVNCSHADIRGKLWSDY